MLKFEKWLNSCATVSGIKHFCDELDNATIECCHTFQDGDFMRKGEEKKNSPQ